MTYTKTEIDTGLNLNNSYAGLPEVFFTKQSPTAVASPKIVILNKSLAADLGLNTQWLESNEGAAVLGGSKIPVGAEPITQAYGGHQFGHFTMLGDGRAILLGEQITPSGQRFDIQLKGSGETPYSRGGDGRAALGPMLREYIISEAMQGLGIPTTRSMAVVTTGQPVIRETVQPGAVLTRIAASHLRVGTFQYAARWCSYEDVKALADYTLKRHFPNSEGHDNDYLFLLKEVVKRQAELISKWQLVGFIHGVMNTDNMAISGETIDYGPCAFMDVYNPATVFSSIDRYGRYAYGNQPKIGAWNLARFAETLLPLLHDNEDQAVKLAEDAVSAFSEIYHHNWLSGMRAKLGIFNEEKEDEGLIEELLTIMKKHGADYTNTFLSLTFDRWDGASPSNNEDFIKWHKLWQERVGRQQQSKDSSLMLMKNNNPALIPRNHRVEEALEAAVKYGDYTVMDRLLDALSNPYAHTEEQAYYSTLPEPSSCAYRTFCGT